MRRRRRREEKEKKREDEKKMKLKMRRYGDYQSDNTGVGDTGQTVVLRYAMIRRIRENRTKIGKIEEKYRSNGANYLK